MPSKEASTSRYICEVWLRIQALPERSDKSTQATRSALVDVPIQQIKLSFWVADAMLVQEPGVRYNEV